jgi:hypothetical protein
MINNIKLDGHILVEKGSLPNKKFTSQKEVNKKKSYNLFWPTSSQNPIHLKFYPNIEKYIWNLQVKFQLDPKVWFRVMINNIKLDGRKFYAKIRIWPCLDRIIISFKFYYLLTFDLRTFYLTRFLKRQKSFKG